PVDILGIEARDMQDGAEDLALHRLDPADPKDAGGQEMPRLRRADPMQEPPLALHLRAVIVDALMLLVVDQRPDIGADRPGVANRQRVHRAIEHFGKRSSTSRWR